MNAASVAPTPMLTSHHEATIEVPSGILSAAVATQQTTLYTAAMDGSIEAHSLSSKQRTVIGQHQSYASGVVTTSDPNTIISAGYDGLLIWHDVSAQKPRHVIKAHDFWSWRLAVSPNQNQVASATGRYRSGGYRYEPATETEPSVKVYDVATAELTHTFEHTPPVSALAFSPDSRFVAAGNLMGDIKVYDLHENRVAASWNTPDFTSWGIIKSHHYIGGIFDLAFSPDGETLFACGMGPMRDPMAGNGIQRWQRFAWRQDNAPKTAAINEDETGKGLMECLTMDPMKNRFIMAGRLAQGQWNTALFDLTSGALLHAIDTKMRTTKALLVNHGETLILCGASSQKAPKEGKWPDFGKIHLYRLQDS